MTYDRSPPGLSLTALLAITLAAALPVTAQTRPDTTDTPVRLAPLTITVLRDLTPVEQVPYSVAGLGEADVGLGKTGAFIEEAIGLLPGLQVQNRYNYAVGERVAIRGFGAQAPFGIRGIHVLVDGVPATMPDGQSTLDHLDLNSLGRVELLRGPGSALYGNAAGGVLALRTEIPTSSVMRPESRIVVGSDGLVNTTAGVRGWIGRSALVANASYLSYGGFRSNPQEEGEEYGEADRGTFNGQLSTSVGSGLLRVAFNGVTLDAENPGSLPAASLSDEDRPAWGFNVAQRTGKEVDQGQVGATWSGTLAEGRAEFGVWGLGRSVLNPIPPAIIDLSRRAGGVRAIFDRSLGTDDDALVPGELTLGAGVEAALQDDDRLNFDNDGGEKGERTLDQNETVRSLGTFVRASLAVSERFSVSGAFRYDHFRFEADDHFVDPASDDPDDSGVRTMDAWSPTLGAIVDAGPLSIWANFSTALQTPTTTELVNRPDGPGGFNPGLEPVESTSFEAGARGGTANGEVSWEVAVFRTDLENELVSFEVLQAPGRRFFRNAGESTHDGVEASVDARLGDGLGVRAVYSRTDARFDRFTVDGEDFSGNRVPGLAPNRFGLRIDQRQSVWHWAVDTDWVDAVPVDDPNTASAPAYWLVGLRAGIEEFAVGQLLLSPSVGVANLFDELYSSSVAVNAFGDRYFEPGPGRTAYVGFGVRWAR